MHLMLTQYTPNDSSSTLGFLLLNSTNFQLHIQSILDRCNSHQGWGQFRNWNWNWYQFQFQELELKRNWIKGVGVGIDREELKELIQFPFLIVNSFWFFAMFLAKSLNQFDLKSFWLQLTRISSDRYIILYDIYQLNGFCMAVIDFISKLHVMDFALENMTQRSFFHQMWPRNLVVNQRL